MLPHIPFAELPRKEYKKGPYTMGGEQKPRMDVVKFLNEGEGILSHHDDSVDDLEDDESSAESEYDLLQHLADLLPGDIQNGVKPTKKANMAHLEDLRVVKKPPDRLKYVKMVVRYVGNWRARERERRKHYLIKEYEKRIKEFDELQKKERDDAMAEEERLIRLEEHRRQKRIERNSRKKKNKMILHDSYIRAVEARDKETARREYLCSHLPQWAIEGLRKQEAQDQWMQEQAALAEAEHKRQQEAAEKAERIRRDRAILDDDKALTAQVESIMLRAGTLHYDHPRPQNEDEQLSQIFETHRAMSVASREREDESEAGGSTFRGTSTLPSITTPSMRRRIKTKQWSHSRPSTADSTISGLGETVLDLAVDPHADLEGLRRELKRSRFGNNRKKKGAAATASHASEHANVFGDVDFTDTGDIRVLYGHHLQTLGTLALANELSQGACPTLEEGRFQNCDMRDPGFLRLLQGLRLGNISSLRVLDLRGNALTAFAIDCFRDVCSFGLFQQLQELNLNDNELHDAGVDAILRVVLHGYFRQLQRLLLCRNSITDKGFTALITMVQSIHERYIPQLQHLALDRNLVSAECKRRFHPLPDFVSV